MKFVIFFGGTFYFDFSPVMYPSPLPHYFITLIGIEEMDSQTWMFTQSKTAKSDEPLLQFMKKGQKTMRRLTHSKIFDGLFA